MPLHLVCWWFVLGFCVCRSPGLGLNESVVGSSQLNDQSVRDRVDINTQSQSI